MYKKFILLISFVFCTTLAFSQNAQVQVIHNSPDISIDIVDIWVDNQSVFDSLRFRTATPYMDFPAGGSFTVSVMNPGVTDTSLALHQQEVNLTAGDSYVMIATGLVNYGLYDSIKPFKLAVQNTRREASQSSHTDVLVFHGAPEEDPLDINETTLPLVPLIDSLRYDNFENYLELPTADYELEVINGITGITIAEYGAPLSNWNLMDSAIVVVVSGFIDSLKSNPGDTTPTPVPTFGLYAALPGGGALMELPVISDIGLDELAAQGFKMYPNPSSGYVTFSFESNAEPSGVELYNLSGSLLKSCHFEEDGSQYRINLSGTRPGAYLLGVKLKDGSRFTRKLILH